MTKMPDKIELGLFYAPAPMSEYFHSVITSDTKAIPEQRAQYTRSDLIPQPVTDDTYLRDTLRDVLKAVCESEAVTDTIWVNNTPIGDEIMSALGEDIDLDELQNSPYRCTKTGELFTDEARAKALEAAEYLHAYCWQGCTDDPAWGNGEHVDAALNTIKAALSQPVVKDCLNTQPKAIQKAQQPENYTHVDNLSDYM